MRGVLVVIGLGASACGQISFGDPLDAGMAVVEDTGPLDSGVVVPDVGPMDLGCTPPVRPPLPSSWPYPATKTGYLENFYNNLPEPDGCGLKSCHGPDPDEFDHFILERAAATYVRPDSKRLAPVKRLHVMAHFQAPLLRLGLVWHPLK